MPKSLSLQEIQKLQEIAVADYLSEEQAKFIAKELEKFKDEYYNKDNSIVADELYDALEKKLVTYLNQQKKLNKNSTKPVLDLVLQNETMQPKVGAMVSAKTAKIPHSIPMLSLDNAFTSEDVIDFDNRIKKFLYPTGRFNQSHINKHKEETLKSSSTLLEEDDLFQDSLHQSLVIENKELAQANLLTNNKELQNNKDIPDITYHVELKIDGLSLAILYEKGHFVKAITRGNGLIGEDVSLNAQSVKNLPLQLKEGYPEFLEVRGEVFISKKNFQLLNKQQIENNEKIFATARNAASGSLRLLDNTESKNRYLEFMPWGLGEVSSNSTNKFSSLVNIFQQLQNMGFTISPYNKLCIGVEPLLEYYHYLASIRQELPFEVDGVVYKVNDTALQERLGVLIKAPRWAIAHKFVAEKVVTCIKNITIQIGRTGVLTPVAELEPIGIGGVLIARVTLHNMDEIKRKDIQIGDYVEVYRAGDVIPKITKVLLDKRTQTTKFTMPKTCPFCGSLVEHVEGEVAIRCSADMFFCKGRRLESFKHFTSKNAMNIEGLSEQTLKFLLDNNYIQEFADIYILQQYQSELIKIKGFGELSITNLLNSIENSKQVNLANLIFALGIPQIGLKNATMLARQYKNIENFINTFQELNQNEELVSQINMQFFGESIITSIYEYVKDAKQQAVLQHLLPHLHVINHTSKMVSNGLFSEKKVLFSGTLRTMSRLEAQALAEKHGAYIVSSVSKNLDYLIVGEKAGSKMKKAQELGITILNEEEFLELIAKTDNLDAENKE
ncbi:DNA ligase [Candidatus Hepatincola sp. Av]